MELLAMVPQNNDRSSNFTAFCRDCAEEQKPSEFFRSSVSINSITVGSVFLRFFRVFRCGDRDVWRRRTEIHEEIVPILCGNMMRREYFGRKVSQIPCHDMGSTAGDRGSEDVTVAGIGKRQLRNVLLIVGDISCGQHPFHQVSRLGQALDRKILRVCREIANPLFMDRVGPTGVDQSIDATLNQEIADMKGIQNAGVIDRDKGLIRHNRV